MVLEPLGVTRVARGFRYHKGSLLAHLGCKGLSPGLQGAKQRMQDAAITNGYHNGSTKVARAGWGLTLSFLKRETGRCCRM